jgi:DNA processing protein
MTGSDADFFRIALSMVPGVGSVKAKLLIDKFGSAQAIFEASTKELLSTNGVSKNILSSIRDLSVIDRAKKELDFIKKNEIQLLYYLEEAYPDRLKVYDDAPICLYYKGNVSLNAKRHVSIIGTRKPTERGKWVCEKMVTAFKDYDITTISGLAYGIDIAAHRASLEAIVPTIGVVAHGLDSIYPSAHRTVARKMISLGGLLTEFPSGTKAERDRFPARNRIIAMMADALIVVESKESGGSMITANFANEYSKDVFAIPGRIDDEASKGCNKLIKEHKAFLLDTAEELIRMMRWEPKTEKEIQRSLFYDLSKEEQQIVESIKMGIDAIDDLCSSLGMPQTELSAYLLDLEIKGILRSLPGKKFMVLS